MPQAVDDDVVGQPAPVFAAIQTFFTFATGFPGSIGLGSTHGLCSTRTTNWRRTISAANALGGIVLALPDFARGTVIAPRPRSTCSHRASRISCVLAPRPTSRASTAADK